VDINPTKDRKESIRMLNSLLDTKNDVRVILEDAQNFEDKKKKSERHILIQSIF